MAWMIVALWFGALALLFRVAPAPGPVPRGVPASVSWWPAEAGGPAGLDLRTLWTPSVFALSTPAGFSHSLRRERSRLSPPVQALRPAAAFLAGPEPAAASDLTRPRGLRWAERGAESAFRPASGGVFPPRIPAREAPRMDFPEGWESRLFSGIDLEFGVWTSRAWSARIEMRFDGAGVPVSTLLAQSSGLPELDRRLARSANGWRLLEPAAPRTGVVAWNRPAPEPPARPAAAGKGAP
ncbi:MAG: hypothetical protein EOM72_07600 [Opitutae bacterium]|nr:hypothetical protein [Opitutae bacterium]